MPIYNKKQKTAAERIRDSGGFGGGVASETAEPPKGDEEDGEDEEGSLRDRMKTQFGRFRDIVRGIKQPASKTTGKGK
jgi:hypothetical protein